jgi:hypothetical protein
VVFFAGAGSGTLSARFAIALQLQAPCHALLVQRSNSIRAGGACTVLIGTYPNGGELLSEEAASNAALDLFVNDPDPHQETSSIDEMAAAGGSGGQHQGICPTSNANSGSRPISADQHRGPN